MFTLVKRALLCLLVAVSTGVTGLGERLTRAERQVVTRYLLSRMLGAPPTQARLDREVGDQHRASSTVYSQVSWFFRQRHNE